MGVSLSELAQLYRNQNREPPPEFADAPALKKRLDKYGRKKKEVDGIMFDSTSEANAYMVLKIWLKAGAISDLRLQPVFTLQEKFKDHRGKTVRSHRYTADFQFFDNVTRRTRYIDVKGIITPAFKRSMLELKDRYPGVEIEIWDRNRVKEMSRV